MTQGRVDTASRIIRASPEAIYRAFMNPQALKAWLPPKGMSCRIHEFDAREGGPFRMSLVYDEPDRSGSAKSTENSDVVRGRFVRLVPGERIVQDIEFESPDPSFAGVMTMTWALAAVPSGTEVTISCENVPEGIRPEDHDDGLRSTLENLAAFTE